MQEILIKVEFLFLSVFLCTVSLFHATPTFLIIWLFRSRFSSIFFYLIVNFLVLSLSQTFLIA
jgi:hypothetical protein